MGHEMKHLTYIALSALIFLLPLATRAQVKSDNCAKCHQGINATNALIVKGYRTDIHFLKGLTCASCHGGDVTKSDETAMDPDKGFVGAPDRKSIPAFCGKCHSNAGYMRNFNPALNVDQEEKYYTSRHGIQLKSGDRKVATCISCHGVHGILPPDNTNSPVYKLNIPATCNKCHGDARYMAAYGIPTDQFEKYSQSVHGIACLEKKMKGAPACNDCHGNHGAAPPGVNDVAAVCITCHSFNGELYNQSPHKEAFKTAGFSQCAACHDHHKIMHPTDAMLGVAEGAVCVKCHLSGDGGYRQAAAMKQLLDSLLTGQTRTKATLARAAELDMDVTDGERALEDTRENVIESRTAIHAFTVDHLKDVTKNGFAAEAKAESLATAAIFEYKFRRAGFGVATLILSGLALLIWLKLRRIEKKRVS
jgi:predicted CXXCH cytochrome family protein